MRLATSVDVLDDRPTEWPRPPPGFTTKRVLMPWHDFKEKRQRGRRDPKRRRKDSSRTRDRGHNNKHMDDLIGGEHPMISKGLRSGRAGFTIEEMQAERSAKRATKEIS